MNEYRIVGRNRKGLAEKIFRFSATNPEAYRLLIQLQLCRETLVREWVLELLGPGDQWLHMSAAPAGKSHGGAMYDNRSTS